MKSWKLIHHTKGFCKLWQDEESGCFSIADYSGRTPEDTDDHNMHGILWIEDDEPIRFRDHFKGTPVFVVRLTAEKEPNKKGEYSTSVDMGFALILQGLTGQPLITEHEGVAYEITPMRSREARPLNELAREANQVQNACNIAGVAGLLQRTHSSLTRRLSSTEQASQHPITRAIIDKLMDLSRMDGRLPWDDWGKVNDLAEGKMNAIEAMGDAITEGGH
jgi:hypothetical protein